MPFRKRAPLISCRVAILVGALGAVIALAIGAPDARAFPTYSGWWLGECSTCHGDFRASTYYPPSRDQTWTNKYSQGALHGNHWDMTGFNCGACHLDGSNPTSTVSMTQSGDSNFPMSCNGCHARAEPDAGGMVTGSGLRRHHWNAGVPCTPCHADSEPSQSFEPAGEHVGPSLVQVDEHEMALDLIEEMLSLPGGVSAAYIKNSPWFASLRGNERFESLVAGAS